MWIYKEIKLLANGSTILQTVFHLKGVPSTLQPHSIYPNGSHRGGSPLWLLLLSDK